MQMQHSQRKSCRAGFTLSEMLIAVAIMMILSLLVITGTREMLRNAKLSGSSNQVLSVLNTARNLAITHSAVYHIRIQNFATANDTAGKAHEYADQAIGIYCYPRANDALAVTLQDRLTGQPSRVPTGEGFEWSTQTHFDLTKSRNTRVEYLTLERGVYVGIQYPVGTVIPVEDNVISFFPDGTASGSFLLFVTNEDILKDNPKATTDPQKALWMEVNNARYASFFKVDLGGSDKTDTQKKLRTGTTQMIQVNKAGLIRFVRGDQGV